MQTTQQGRYVDKAAQVQDHRKLVSVEAQVHSGEVNTDDLSWGGCICASQRYYRKEAGNSPTLKLLPSTTFPAV